MEKLAINGGYPVREGQLGYGHQYIDDDDVKAVSDVLTSSFITTGPKVDELERELERYTGSRYAVVVSSGTAALHCACIAIGLAEGDEVITTPFTFAASANCVLYCGARPVFADIDPETYNIDPEKIREKITDRTKAIIAVDYAGQSVRNDEIRNICDEFGLVFIEDAAHAIATEYKGKKVGNIADITIFSFHPVKTITGGEGGAILTNNSDYYKKALNARSHGIVHLLEDMENKEPEGPWYYEMISLGYNYRITDFQAALVLSQMKKLFWFRKRRQEIVKYYDEEFSEMDEIISQKEIPESDSCRHLYTIRLNPDKLNCTRREFFDALVAENIVCQIHYIPIYWFPYYQRMGYEMGQCPNAEYVYKNIMSIPLYPALKDQDIKDVVHAVKKVVENYRK